MRAVITRVLSASVSMEGETISSIGAGFLVLLGIHTGDNEDEARKLADKVCGLRIFEDKNGKMNLSALQTDAELLIVPNFTLYADCSSRRPGFSNAARPEIAEELYELFIKSCRETGLNVLTGVFGGDMLVQSANDGPVTIIIDTLCNM